MKKNKKKEVNKKFYLYIILTILIVLFLAWYIISWYNVKEEEKYRNSYLLSTNTVVYEIDNLDEVKQAFQEAPSNYFVFISYTGNKDVFRLERKLKSIIDNYGLKDEFYYINVTDIMENDDLYNKLNDSFNTMKIKAVPSLLYYSDGKFEEIVQLKDGVFNYTEVLTLLNNYEYEKISE